MCQTNERTAMFSQIIMLKKSKKQKADYPRYDLVKAAEFFVKKIIHFFKDNGTILDKILSFMRFVFTSDVQIGTF